MKLYEIFAVTLMVVTTIAICVGVGVIWHDETAKARQKRSVPKSGPRAATVPRVRPESLEPESLEGVLARQLLAGAITKGQYLHALEGIAAREECRHPLSVPPEPGPS